MKNYILVYFLPGSAGNFFCRALGLLSNKHYVFAPTNSTPGQIHLSVAEKFKLFSYKKTKPKNWIVFEDELTSHLDFIDHTDLPSGCHSIIHSHPDYQIGNKNFAGDDDQLYTFYIDPGSKFEWAFYNGLYKDSVITKTYCIIGKQMLNDPNIVKISLENIIASHLTFLLEIQKIADITGVILTNESRELITELWHQWYATTLKPEDFSKFKEQIGFLI